MLTSLLVENLAVIKRVELEFGKGINVITGETGAGKSILVEAINLLSGKKSSSDCIRSGEDVLVVEAVFSLDDGVKSFLETVLGIECDDELILRREIKKDSRSKAYVQGRNVPLSVLREIVPRIVDIHSQFSTQALLKPSSYLSILDSYGCISEMVGEFSDKYRRYVELKDRLKELEGLKEQVSKELQLYRHQLKELSSVDFEHLDEEELKSELLRMQNLSIVKDNLSSALLFLSEEGSGAWEVTSAAKKCLQNAAEFDTELKDICKRMDNLLIDLKELINDIDSYQNSLYLDHERLNELVGLVDKVEFLKRKYGASSIEELCKYKREVEEEIRNLSLFDVDYGSVLKELSALKEEIYTDVSRISKQRKVAAERLSSEVEKHIKSLAMRRASFKVEVSQGNLSATGYDKVDFMLRTNVGQEFLSLSRVASGGELSRVMLALKVVLGEKYGVPTVIFDEIDIGIGGSAVSSVAEKIKELGKHRQVIMITHLPMLAAISNRHYVVCKYDEGGETFVDVELLEDNEKRVKELARMLGAGRVTQKVLEHAEELLREKNG